MTSPTPRYKAIEDFLLERIHGGAYPVNHQIPPEEQLARDFGVSRMTANKAIQNLVQKGYLVRQAGLGTFVTDRKAESPLHEVMNIASEVRGRGHAYSNEVVRCEAIAADDEVALRLGLRLGGEVFHSILVHLQDGLPIQLEDRSSTRAGCRITCRATSPRSPPTRCWSPVARSRMSSMWLKRCWWMRARPSCCRSTRPCPA